MMEGKTVRNMSSVVPKLNKFDTLVHLVGFTIEIITESHIQIFGDVSAGTR